MINKLISIETQIIKATIDILLNDGYIIAVSDGEDIALAYTRNASAILSAMRTTDEDYLMARRGNFSLGFQNGWVRFIYGNEDIEVINDYTTNLENVMVPIFKMIDKYEDAPWSI